MTERMAALNTDAVVGAAVGASCACVAPDGYGTEQRRVRLKELGQRKQAKIELGCDKQTAFNQPSPSSSHRS